MAKIEPTVGRVVWYRAASDEDGPHGQHDGDQPQAAMVARINEDGTLNLTVLAGDGTPYARQNILLVQDGTDLPDGHGTSYAEWMPYQKGQAKKTEELEKQIEPKPADPPAPEAGAGLA